LIVGTAAVGGGGWGARTMFRGERTKWRRRIGRCEYGRDFNRHPLPEPRRGAEEEEISELSTEEIWVCPYRLLDLPSARLV